MGRRKEGRKKKSAKKKKKIRGADLYLSIEKKVRK